MKCVGVLHGPETPMLLERHRGSGCQYVLSYPCQEPWFSWHAVVCCPLSSFSWVLTATQKHLSKACGLQIAPHSCPLHRSKCQPTCCSQWTRVKLAHAWGCSRCGRVDSSTTCPLCRPRLCLCMSPSALQTFVLLVKSLLAEIAPLPPLRLTPTQCIYREQLQSQSARLRLFEPC